MQENARLLRGVLTNPTADPWYGFGREQLSHRAGVAQVKQMLMDSIVPVAAVPRQCCVATDVLCICFSD